MPERFGFIHIPKAAGVSITSTLNRLGCEDVQIGSAYDLANFPDLFHQTRILAGHIPRFMFEWEEDPRHLATVLRDPTDRVLSNYRYILTTPGHYAHRYFQQFRPSLADCFAHPVLRIEFENFQTKMLGFSPRSGLKWPAHGRRKFRAFSVAYAEFLYSQASWAMLARARHVLSRMRFGCVGKPSSMIALCASIAGTAATELDVVNRTPAVEWEPSARDLRMVSEHNRFDAELYRFALALLEEGSREVESTASPHAVRRRLPGMFLAPIRRV